MEPIVTNGNGHLMVDTIVSDNNVHSTDTITTEERQPLRNEPKKEESEQKTGLKFQCGILTWLTSNIHILPIFTAFYFVIVFFITYGIAVAYGHVEPDFPYISYTGVHPPERGWFSQLVNVGAILMAINLYIRYMIIHYIVQTTSQTHATSNVIVKPKRIIFLNKLFLTFGLLSAIGLSMVANFQTVDMRVMHYIGAALAFLFGWLYCWTQSWVTRELNKVDDCKHFQYIGRLQLAMSCILTVFLITFGTSKIIYKNGTKNGFGTKWDTLRAPYLLSTSMEWLSVLLGCAIFTLTYFPDFKKYKLTGPRVELKQSGDAIESQTYALNTL